MAEVAYLSQFWRVHTREFSSMEDQLADLTDLTDLAAVSRGHYGALGYGENLDDPWTAAIA
jgi:hypothetical protein